jgi:glycosyltransferase involved in cell wall biosynthesis
MRPFAIHQFLPSFSPWDAIGNETRLMRNELRSMGFESDIFCEHRHPSLRSEAIQVQGSKMKDLGRNILIFHFSVATSALLRLASSKSAICLRYHNVTPEWFFDPVKDAAAHAVCKLGRRQLPMAASIARWGLCDSEFNASDLRASQMSDVKVMPLLRDYDLIANLKPDESLLRVLKPASNSVKTVLFVGRLAPNKRQEDLIELIKVYKDCIDKNIRLILVGSAYSLAYDHALKQFARDLGLAVASGKPSGNGSFDVLFADGVSDTELATYYRSSDAFVCASEHEGFCVPVVEAMRFGLPILAHDSTALKETVGGAGFVVDKFDQEAFVLGLKRILTDESFKSSLIQERVKRLASFTFPQVRASFKDHVERMAQEFAQASPA